MPSVSADRDRFDDPTISAPPSSAKVNIQALGWNGICAGLEHMQPPLALKVRDQPQRRRFGHAQVIAGQ